MTINEVVQKYEASKRALEALQADGVQLPFRPAFIAAQELRGHTVDLETGAIIINGAGRRHGPTVAGLEVAEGG